MMPMLHSSSTMISIARSTGQILPMMFTISAVPIGSAAARISACTLIAPPCREISSMLSA